MKFVSTEEYGSSGNQLGQSSYANRRNALGYLRKEFRTRSLEASADAGKRILRSTLPELSVSRVGDSLRIFALYLKSLKYVPRDEARLEPIALASAYISARSDGECVSLFHMTSKLGLPNYKSFASLVRRVCARIGIESLPDCPLSESLDEVSSRIENYIRGERFEATRARESASEGSSYKDQQAAQEEKSRFGLGHPRVESGRRGGDSNAEGTFAPPERTFVETDSMQRDLLLESLLGNSCRKAPCCSPQDEAGGRRPPKRHSRRRKCEAISPESFKRSKEFAREILQVVLESRENGLGNCVRDDILSPLWLVNGSSVSPLVCGALVYSFKMHCKELTIKDVAAATGVSKSAIINSKKIISKRLLLISQKLFPGWINSNLHTDDKREDCSAADLPPTVVRSLIRLIRSSLADANTCSVSTTPP
ncbi:hypothetical protein FG386_000689 [Cryptosporidium ryanae]|uniref:uncharacterized protein n=1 Tax=Cryptosporidium ryanae TaxID=515981 RepID=UPI00351A3FE5|nr:hypothetical protein FG386_000689 [Cryptosporidium ryanae]